MKVFCFIYLNYHNYVHYPELNVRGLYALYESSCKKNQLKITPKYCFMVSNLCFTCW